MYLSYLEMYLSEKIIALCIVHHSVTSKIHELNIEQKSGRR